MRTLSLLAFSVLPLLLVAQKPFPSLTGETASGTTITLPKATGKPWKVVGIAYSQKASSTLEDWYEPAYLRFVAKHGLFASAYDAEVYFIPLFVGVNKAAYEPSMKKFRKSAEPAIVEHVLFSKEEIDPLKAALDLTDKDIPYFFVLDAEGNIVHREEGTFSDAKLEALEEAMLQ